MGRQMFSASTDEFKPVWFFFFVYPTGKFRSKDTRKFFTGNINDLNLQAE